MGGYVLPDGQKVQTDEYIEYLASSLTQAQRERDAALERVEELERKLRV